MRVGFPVIGVILLLAGLVWFLQGINILPGSFMTGDPFWAWMGIASFVGGLVLLFVGAGRRSRT
jgi:hypothetical protein